MEHLCYKRPDSNELGSDSIPLPQARCLCLTSNQRGSYLNAVFSPTFTYYISTIDKLIAPQGNYACPFMADAL